jgi:hypothetical protein
LETIDHNGAAPAERLNYFNYFTEVEEEFVRRRGKHMLISPIDWALVETWKNAGIPLHIVLRGINEAFDNYDARPHKYRLVNNLFYCQQAVESAYAQYRLAQVGGADLAQQAEPGPSAPKASERAMFSKEVILDFLARCYEELRVASSNLQAGIHADLRDALERSLSRLREITDDIERAARLDAEALERDLDAIDRMILESVAAACSEEEIQELNKEAKKQLRSYRKKMNKEIYEHTVQNFVSRRLREINNIPRLSLFYL